MTEIFTASTLEEAKQKAADAFGAPLSDIQFTVLEEPKRSFFGGLFGKNDTAYRIQADYTPAAAEAPAVQEPAAASVAALRER